jgi:hypothetical protein
MGEGSAASVRLCKASAVSVRLYKGSAVLVRLRKFSVVPECLSNNDTKDTNLTITDFYRFYFFHK